MSPGVGRTEAPRPTSSFPSQVVLTTRQRSEFTEMASSPSFEDLPEPALPASEPSAEVATVVEEDWQADGLLGAHPPTDAKHSEKRFSNDIEMGAKKAEDGAKDGAEKAAAAHDDDPPPDGGYGWVMVLSSFLIQAFTLGFQTSYGSFQRYFITNNTFSTSSNVQLAFVSSISTAVTFFFGPFVGQLTERVGFRPAALAGSIILLLGLELASLATAVWHLYLTYGLIVGIGCALAYIPALGVVPLWFRKHLGLAIGLSVSGGGIGGLILNPVIQAMLETVGFRWAFRILGFIAGGVGFVGAALLRSRGAPPPRKPGLKSLVDFSRFKDLTFARLYALAICSGMGYFVPYVYLVPYAGSIGISASSAAVIMGITNAFGAIGRIAMGFIADRAGPMNCWTISFYVGSLSILAVWTNATSYGLVLFFGLLWGAASGAYVSLYGVNTAVIYGPQGQASLLGMLYTALIPGALCGPVIGGGILDSTATHNPDGTVTYHYLGLQLYAGFCVFAAATILLWVRLEFGAKKGGKGVWKGIWIKL